MSKLITRRNLLLGGAAAGALAVGVGGYAATATGDDFYAAMLRAQLPGVHIPDDAIRAFTRESYQNRNSDFAPKLKMLAAGVRVLGYDTVAHAMRNNFAFEKFNREFLTNFLLGSNIFQLDDPRSGEITYTGKPRACSNPFAQFEEPAH